MTFSFVLWGCLSFFSFALISLESLSEHLTMPGIVVAGSEPIRNIRYFTLRSPGYVLDSVKATIINVIMATLVRVSQPTTEEAQNVLIWRIHSHADYRPRRSTVRHQLYVRSLLLTPFAEFPPSNVLLFEHAAENQLSMRCDVIGPRQKHLLEIQVEFTDISFLPPPPRIPPFYFRDRGD